MESNEGYYEILGVEESASGDKIKDAFRKLAFQYHPDRNPGDDAAMERMKKINEAYAVLSDPGKRRNYDGMRRQYGSSTAYDQFRRTYSERDIFRDSDINQIFEEMARSFGTRGFEEIFRGIYGSGFRTFEFRRPGMFGKFIIFGPGGRPDYRPEMKGAPPRPGLIGRVAGYLLKRAFGSADEPVHGGDFHDVIDLEPHQALAGGKVAYRDRRRGKELLITIPPGTREGQILRLKGMGEAERKGVQPGDLYIKVEFRKPLLQKVRNLLKI